MSKNVKSKNNNDRNKNNKYSWIIIVTVVAFILSIVFSSLSELIVPNINMIFGIILIILFIVIGLIFDMIGVAVTAASERPFHAMASKKIKGSKISINLIKNADKVASICNDVVGDVCGVVSGGAGILITNVISKTYNLNSSLTVLIVTSLIAALIISAKALGKSYAIRKSEKITFIVGKILNIFSKK